MVIAELCQEKQLMTWLVEAGCVVNCVTSQRGTALHVAVDACPVFTESLLELGADPNILMSKQTSTGGESLLLSSFIVWFLISLFRTVT